MLDSAAPAGVALAEEIESHARVAADHSRALDERIEAFEDIIDAEVGDTDLVRARNLERMFGLRQLHLKFEGGNPSGTQKDRIAFTQALDALRRGFDTLTVATCGNYGVAVASAARLSGLRAVVFIPTSYQTKREAEMVQLGVEIVRSSGDYEAAVEASRRYSLANEDVYDANPGGSNLDLQLRAYGAIAWEIYDELRDAPAAVAVPVSNGTTLAGVHRGFVSLYRRGKTSRIPRMIAGSAWRKNPIVAAWKAGLSTCEDLEPTKIRETPINEPLINWHSIDGDLALDAIRGSEGWAGQFSDKVMTQTARQLREQQGLSALPASTAGLSALLERHQADPLAGDRYVVLITGRK